MPDRENFIHEQEACVCTDEPQEDVVIANHVIHYFPSVDYTAGVLSVMLRKARRVIAISGIPDEAIKTASETFRRGLLTPEEYAKKYNGLEILYFKRQWFTDIAGKHGFTAEFFEHTMPGFAQNQFRYDCVLKRTR